MDALRREGWRRPANMQHVVLERTGSSSCLSPDGAWQEKDGGEKKHIFSLHWPQELKKL